MDQAELMDSVHEIFDGRDPLTEAHEKLSQLEQKDLISLVLIAANKVGTLLKGSDYEDAVDGYIHMCHGIDFVFSAYDQVLMQQQANTDNIGSA